MRKQMGWSSHIKNALFRDHGQPLHTHRHHALLYQRPPLERPFVAIIIGGRVLTWSQMTTMTT